MNPAERATQIVIGRMFDGRDGHGGKGSGIGKRVLSRDEAAAYIEAAFEMGRSTSDAELERLRKVEASHRWQPIESAPKDGSTIQVARFMESFGWILGTSYWNPTLGGGWISRGTGTFGELGLAHPTHWQPMAQSPDIASYAYELADAMLRERAKP